MSNVAYMNAYALPGVTLLEKLLEDCKEGIDSVDRVFVIYKSNDGKYHVRSNGNLEDHCVAHVKFGIVADDFVMNNIVDERRG